MLISHSSGDEGDDYATRIREYSEVMGVNTICCGDRIDGERSTTAEGKKVYSLRDVFGIADIVTYPSTVEGFGNGFLEAVYYRKPIVVNNYAIYDLDIRPKGFRTIEMDHYMTGNTVRQAKEVLANKELADEMVEVNYKLGRRYFSYEVLEQQLATLLMNCFGRSY